MGYRDYYATRIGRSSRDRMNRPRSDTPDPAETRYVSTAQAADALGVSVTTVKRWVDDGVIPAHRTVGKHRKLLTADLLRLVRDGTLPRADLGRLLTSNAATDADPAAVCRRLLDAVGAGDLDVIRAIIPAAYRNGMTVETLADAVIAPMFQQIGHEWRDGRIEVLREHRVTQACVGALYGLAGTLRAPAGPDRPVAVGGATEHDHSLLPTLLAKMTLLDAGWNAVNLGPHTPMSAFRAAIVELRPSLVWVSATHVLEPATFVAEFNAFSREAETRGVAVVIGGQALTEGLRRQMRYASFGDGLTHLAAFARSLHPRPRPPSRGRVVAT